MSALGLFNVAIVHCSLQDFFFNSDSALHGPVLLPLSWYHETGHGPVRTLLVTLWSPRCCCFSNSALSSQTFRCFALVDSTHFWARKKASFHRYLFYRVVESIFGALYLWHQRQACLQPSDLQPLLVYGSVDSESKKNWSKGSPKEPPDVNFTQKGTN